MWPGMSISGITRMWRALRVGHEAPHLALREMGVGHDLRMRAAGDPEALVVGEVQVQLVELEVGQLANPRAQPARAEVPAAVVQHQAALGIARPVARRARRDRALAPQELDDAAGAVERAGGGARLDAQHGAYLEPVALPPQLPVGGAERQLDVPGLRGDAGQDRMPPAEVRAQQPRLGQRAARGHDDPRRVAQHERPRGRAPLAQGGDRGRPRGGGVRRGRSGNEDRRRGGGRDQSTRHVTASGTGRTNTRAPTSCSSSDGSCTSTVRPPSWRNR